MTVVAHGDLETLRVAKDGFFHLVTQFPKAGIEVMCALAFETASNHAALDGARARLRELGGAMATEARRTTRGLAIADL